MDTSTETSQVPNHELYSPGHVAWASLLGWPVAGCVLLAINYSRLGRSKSGWIAVICGSIATVMLFVVAFFFPVSIPKFVIPLTDIYVMRGMAKWFQGDALDWHLANGSQKASVWRATGIGFVFLLGLSPLLVAGVLLRSGPPADYAHFNAEKRQVVLKVEGIKSDHVQTIRETVEAVSSVQSGSVLVNAKGRYIAYKTNLWTSKATPEEVWAAKQGNDEVTKKLEELGLKVDESKFQIGEPLRWTPAH